MIAIIIINRHELSVIDLLRSHESKKKLKLIKWQKNLQGLYLNTSLQLYHLVLYQWAIGHITQIIRKSRFIYSPSETSRRVDRVTTSSRGRGTNFSRNILLKILQVDTCWYKKIIINFILHIYVFVGLAYNGIQVTLFIYCRDVENNY